MDNKFINFCSRLINYYIKNQMNPIAFRQDSTMSTNPRLILTEKGRVISADDILPKGGITDGVNTFISSNGLEAVFGLCASTCREGIANKLRDNVNRLNNQIIASGKKAEINYSGVVKLKNKYHISIGGIELRGGSNFTNDAIHNPNVLIPMLDAFVGNTCVLLDRNKNLKAARKQDLPRFVTTAQGIEYQGVTSFWMQSVPLSSLVLGMARFALDLVAQSTNEAGKNYVEKVNSLVKQSDIQKAIKNNDFNLAYKNFKKLESFIVEVVGEATNNYPLSKNTMAEFHHFIKKGIGYWFNEDFLFHWISGKSTYRRGIESFLYDTVRKDMIGKPKPVVNIGEIKMVRFAMAA